MNKKRIIKTTINCLAVILVTIIFFNYTDYYLTPLSAHKSTEKQEHYGPSEIKHVEELGDLKVYLCKYKNWVSCDSVKKSSFLFWNINNNVFNCFEYNKSISLNYEYSNVGGGYNCIYGIINDTRIKKIEVELENGVKFTRSDFYDGLFIINWDKYENYKIIYNYKDDAVPKNIYAYDEIGNIIFSSDRVACF